MDSIVPSSLFSKVHENSWVPTDLEAMVDTQGMKRKRVSEVSYRPAE